MLIRWAAQKPNDHTTNNIFFAVHFRHISQLLIVLVFVMTIFIVVFFFPKTIVLFDTHDIEEQYEITLQAIQMVKNSSAHHVAQQFIGLTLSAVKLKATTRSKK